MFMRSLAAAVIVMAAAPASARPDGADWGHDGGPGRPDCSACHFDHDPLQQHEALKLEGFPARVEPGARYVLALTLRAEATAKAGFLLRSEVDGADGGEFAAMGDGLEARGVSLRSTRARSPSSDGVVRWRFEWRAPEKLGSGVRIYVAANAGNDDLSPFGDQVYLSVFEGSPGR